MIRLLLCLSLMLSLSVAYAEKPAGFLWYNLPKEDSVHKKPKPGSVAFSKLSYTDRDAVLGFYTMEALHKVRFTHDIEDERVFLALQDFWLKEQPFRACQIFDFGKCALSFNRVSKLQTNIRSGVSD